MGIRILSLVPCAESLKHEVGGRVDVLPNEALEDVIVAIPDEVISRGKRGVGARKGPVKPRSESLFLSQKGEPIAPFHPIVLIEVKDKVRGPGIFVESAFDESDAAGSDAKVGT